MKGSGGTREDANAITSKRKRGHAHGQIILPSTRGTWPAGWDMSGGGGTRRDANAITAKRVHERARGRVNLPDRRGTWPAGWDMNAGGGTRRTPTPLRRCRVLTSKQRICWYAKPQHTLSRATGGLAAGT